MCHIHNNGTTFLFSHFFFISSHWASKSHFRPLHCFVEYMISKELLTKNLQTASNGSVSLKEIACLQENRIKSVQIIKSWYFTSPAGGL